MHRHRRGVRIVADEGDLCIPVFMVPMAIGIWLWVPEHAGKKLNEISV